MQYLNEYISDYRSYLDHEIAHCEESCGHLLSLSGLVNREICLRQERIGELVRQREDLDMIDQMSGRN